MATLAELAQSHTDLKPDELEHLQRLLGSWSVLADLSFSDLLLLVPVRVLDEGAEKAGAGSAVGVGGAVGVVGPVGGRGTVGEGGPVGGGSQSGDDDEGGVDPELIVLGQMRPNNRPTLVDQDLVGQTVNESQWTLVARCLHTGEIVRGSIHHPILGEQVPVENIPVRFNDRLVAALLRVSLAPLKGPTSMYERTYLDVFERLADMVTQSAFPFPEEDVGTEEAPRVGDGVVVVDADGRIEFASPNAMNAFHRMGIYAQPEGRRFADLDIEESAVEWALATGRPVVEEVERRPDVIVLVHCIPLLSHGVVTGAMILLRDVTDVRRLDRLLLSKDAAIREVHHRVKNNLQTISSLLSLQARRIDDRTARMALQESERRVRSIALVHEILSRDPSDQVPFSKIVKSLIEMAEDSVVSSQPIAMSVHGDLGDVAADVATPLALALAELLQNVVDHAFDPHAAAGHDGAGHAGAGLEGAGGASGYAQIGHVDLTMSNEDSQLCIEVRDDGFGLPEGFDIEHQSTLGLSIVRDLVVRQLEGDITVEDVPVAEGGGTRAAISVPVRAPR
jgi:two-component sensor histidine kinase